MTKYYHGSNVNVINELAGEIENGLEEINEELNILESYNWDEIFEHVSNSQQLLNDVESAISNIRGVLDSLSK